MAKLKDALESTGLKAQRGVWTGKVKPAAYYTFQRLYKNAAVRADDREQTGRELYRVTLISKRDFEAQLEAVKEALEDAGYYINSIDAESYETETGYWLIPITIEELKETGQ